MAAATRHRTTDTVAVGLCLVAAAMPFYLSSFWLQTGLFCFAASIGAMGLNLLVGAAVVGQRLLPRRRCLRLLLLRRCPHDHGTVEAVRPRSAAGGRGGARRTARRAGRAAVQPDR